MVLFIPLSKLPTACFQILISFLHFLFSSVLSPYLIKFWSPVLAILNKSYSHKSYTKRWFVFIPICILTALISFLNLTSSALLFYSKSLFNANVELKFHWTQLENTFLGFLIFLNLFRDVSYTFNLLIISLTTLLTFS